MLRRKPEEVLGMWSDALRILDENSMKFYVEQLEEKVRIIEAKVTEKVTAEVTAEVTAQKDKEIQKIRQEKDAEIEALKRQIEELKRK